MKFSHIIFCSVIVASLTACGGGGSDAPAPVDAKLSQHIVNGAQAAAPVVVPEKKFEGGFVTIDGVPNGYLAGTNPRNLAEQIGAFVVANATKWPEQYRNMLSDKGMIVSVAGERTGTNSINGVPTYASPTVFTVKLTTNGVVVTQI